MPPLASTHTCTPDTSGSSTGERGRVNGRRSGERWWWSGSQWQMAERIREPFRQFRRGATSGAGGHREPGPSRPGPGNEHESVAVLRAKADDGNRSRGAQREVRPSVLGGSQLLPSTHTNSGGRVCDRDRDDDQQLNGSTPWHAPPVYARRSSSVSPPRASGFQRLLPRHQRRMP
jgi:hypothetical protein